MSAAIPGDSSTSSVPDRAEFGDDRELLRLHRRACTDMAARMCLPRWDHLEVALAPPVENFSVRDLLGQVVTGNSEFAADLLGQRGTAEIKSEGSDPFAEALESIRTILTVVAGIEPEAGFAPQRREQFWARIVELVVLGHDLQQAIYSGAGVDDLIAERVISVGPDHVIVWPGAEPIEIQESGPEALLLAMAGRTTGVKLVADDGCATGRC